MAMIRPAPPDYAHAIFRVVIDLIGGQSRQFVRQGNWDSKDPPEFWTRQVRDEELSRVAEHRSLEDPWVTFTDLKTANTGAYRSDAVVGVTVEIVSVPPPKE